ncbi:MAG: hypothetical protein IPI52_07350 [Bacteroidetes bacterium]|nr:hypothetical protein [Bacteroidota bacterium]
MENLEKDYGFKLDTLKITGGGSKNQILDAIISRYN